MDDAGLAELRERLARVVARTCPAWLQSRSDDVVQSALLRIHKKAGDGLDLDSLGSAYLSRVAYTCLVDEIRYQRRRRALETQSTDDRGLELTDERHDPEKRAAALELGRAIKACLGLIAKSRSLAVALYLEGSGAVEVALRLGWKRKQADNAVYRGLADMRRCLTEKGVAP